VLWPAGLAARRGVRPRWLPDRASRAASPFPPQGETNEAPCRSARIILPGPGPAKRHGVRSVALTGRVATSPRRWCA